MLYIDCRHAHTNTDETMAYGILPSLPGYEMEPCQHYYGEPPWREDPSVWMLYAWARTPTYRSLSRSLFLPHPEWALGVVGLRWMIFRFRKDSAYSQYFGHSHQQHLRGLRELAAQLQAVKGA
jgi:hypothetical protein